MFSDKRKTTQSQCVPCALVCYYAGVGGAWVCYGAADLVDIFQFS